MFNLSSYHHQQYFISILSISVFLTCLLLILSYLILYLFCYKIDLEFNLIHEGKEHNFLMNWRDVSQKIVAISRGNKKLESCLHFKDGNLFIYKSLQGCCNWKHRTLNFKSIVIFVLFSDALNAMCVLTKYLPRAKRVYQWENKMNPDPAIDDFVQVEPVSLFHYWHSLSW